MNQQEKTYFLNLCDETTSSDILAEGITYSTPSVLGYLFLHRMAASAYWLLEKSNLLSQINREFRNSIRMAYEYGCEQNRSFLSRVAYVDNVLSQSGCRFALLKGSALCGLFPTGCRTANDIDILVLPEQITEIGNALKAAGFQQGAVKNNRFVPATRSGIIRSKMMRGETIPYVKEINLPGMPFLEIDINFSLDYQNTATETLSLMLQCSGHKDVNGLLVHTLSDDDFFLHLCCHLYKEATTLPWIKMGRDMTLYKYRDIQFLLNRMSDEQIETMFYRAQQLHLSAICAFGVLQTADLLTVTNKLAISKAKDILHGDPFFLHEIVAPGESNNYLYIEKNIRKRFFYANRCQLLKEVT